MIGENDSVKTLLFLNTRKSANHSRHSETLQRHRDVRHFNSWKAFSQNCYLIRHKKTYCRQKCIDDSSQAALTTLLTEASVGRHRWWAHTLTPKFPPSFQSHISCNPHRMLTSRQHRQRAKPNLSQRYIGPYQRISLALVLCHSQQIILLFHFF